MESKKDWKKFEEHSHKTIKELNPKSNVLKNVRIEGKFSKVQRQVDIQKIEPNQYDFIAFECKDHKRSIDIPIVEAFATKLKDIGAKKGAIVANSKYTEGAQNLATKLNIDLLNLVNTSNKKIRAKIYAGLLLVDTSTKKHSVKIWGVTQSNFLLPIDPTKLTFVDSNGVTATAYEIFVDLWNETDSLSKEPGVYEYFPPTHPEKKVLDMNGQLVTFQRMAFVYEVVRRYYLGKIEIIDAKGLYNVRDSSFQTRRITTQKIVPYVLERKWKDIGPEEAKKAEGKYTFRLDVNSIMPKKPRRGYKLGNKR